MKTSELLNLITDKLTGQISFWNTGVILYAMELLADYTAPNIEANSNLEKVLLKGAPNWRQFSWCCYTLSDADEISNRLLGPNSSKAIHMPFEQYEGQMLNLQTQALCQAFLLIESLLNH